MPHLHVKGVPIFTAITHIFPLFPFPLKMINPFISRRTSAISSGSHKPRNFHCSSPSSSKPLFQTKIQTSIQCPTKTAIQTNEFLITLSEFIEIFLNFHLSNPAPPTADCQPNSAHLPAIARHHFHNQFG
jgi:hypothetical protein